MQEQELIDRMTALVPLLEAHASEAERLRRPVDVVMRAIEDTQAYRWFVLRRFGGFEFSLEGFVRVGMALGEGCLSTARVTTFCMEHNRLMGLFDREAQEDIFGSRPYIIAPGALAPKAKAVAVEGGFRPSGRWEWGTGVMHADWVMVGATGPGASPGAALVDSPTYRLPMLPVLGFTAAAPAVGCARTLPRQSVAALPARPAHAAVSHGV